MLTKFIEATNGENWGKFMLAQFTTEEWRHKSQVDVGRSLLRDRGWTERHVWVLDLQTGEGAFFLPGGCATSDLNKHAIWVCPMYEPFLNWFYDQARRGKEIDKLPEVVTFTTDEAPSSLYGYRRSGPNGIPSPEKACPNS